MKVFILGCGPSGLLAAHAAVERGHDVEILSIKAKSQMPGTMHVHESIPELCDPEPEFSVDYVKIGTPEGYGLKVYGSRAAPVSFSQFDSGARPAWSMRKMYDKLWMKYEGLIVDRKIDSANIDPIINRCDLVISSIHAQTLCQNPFHQFNGQKVWLGDWVPSDMNIPDNTVVYNGDPLWEWYRVSRIDGHNAIESTSEFPGAFSGIKPTHNNCDCFPSVKRVGRFGQWKKGVLVHHSYKQAIEHLEATCIAQAV